MSTSISDVDKVQIVGSDKTTVWNPAGVATATNQALIVPAANAAAITPNDSADLATPTRSLYVGVAGNVKVDMVTSGTGIVFVALDVGEHPLQVKKVYATGTTATNLIGLS